MDVDPTSCELSLARAELVAWLHARDGDGTSARTKVGSDVVIAEEELAAHFLKRAKGAGFGLEILPVSRSGRCVFQSYWTLHGDAFVGFQQVPKAADPEHARLLACSALLRNDWCRRRLVMHEFVCS